MNSLREVVISLIFSCIAIGLSELLIPENSFKNQMRLITGTVLIVSMLTPFSKGIELENFDFPSSRDSYDVTQNVEKSVAYAVKNEVAEILIENNVESAGITVNTGYDENNSIIVESVIILFDKQDKSNEKYLVKAVESQLDMKVKAGERINE